ncbi:hypothetical protein GF362_04820 [Candidatus Dojkabacteria bacterium]|nr:hypothetical protein [Candidatus Dojkabacteria bacterium]
MTKQEITQFSKTEGGLFHEAANYRTKLFLPLTLFLAKIGVKPDMLSFIGLLFMAGFWIYAKSNPFLALIFLAISTFFDGLDGPLARVLKKDPNKGAFTDILCDHTRLAIVSISFIYHDLINHTLGSIYLYIYTILLIFVVIRNKMGKKPKLVMRSKYFLYFVYTLYALFNIDFLNQSIIIFTLLKIPSLVYSFFVIKKNL